MSVLIEEIILLFLLISFQKIVLHAKIGDILYGFICAAGRVLKLDYPSWEDKSYRELWSESDSSDVIVMQHTGLRVVIGQS